MTDTKYPVVVPGCGPIPCDLMIVGEAPGREEIKQGIPFCGRSGMLLDDALHKAGTHRINVYITNCFKGDVGEGNRNPTLDEMDDHAFELIKELKDIRPKHVLLLGSIAIKRFMPFKRVSDVVGKSFDDSFCEHTNKAIYFKTYPCYHPAYVLRGRRVDVVNSFYSAIYNFIND